MGSVCLSLKREEKEYFSVFYHIIHYSEFSVSRITFLHMVSAVTPVAVLIPGMLNRHESTIG